MSIKHTPYNPLDKKNLGKSVADALLQSVAVSLGELEKFDGAGIYCLYYMGDFPCYASIADLNNLASGPSVPIYVGKAVPKGARQGKVGLDADPGTVLHGRLNEHAKSIKHAVNIDLSDFMCRFLVVEDIWIPLGESLLIAKFSPLWNQLITGFGNHDPGSGRYKQARSRWDVLHPGRAWALKCPDRTETGDQIQQEIEAYLLANPPADE